MRGEKLNQVILILLGEGSPPHARGKEHYGVHEVTQ